MDLYNLEQTHTFQEDNVPKRVITIIERDLPLYICWPVAAQQKQGMNIASLLIKIR